MKNISKNKSLRLLIALMLALGLGFAGPLPTGAASKGKATVSPFPIGAAQSTSARTPQVLASSSTLGLDLTGSGFVSAADWLLGQQDVSGGFPWTPGGPITSNTQGPSANGLLKAYEHTGNTIYLDGAVANGDFLVTSYPRTYTDGDPRFATHDPYFLEQLSQMTGDATYADFVQTYFWDKLTAGTYGETDDMDAADFGDYVVDDRTSQGIVELSPWDLSATAIAAHIAGETASRDALMAKVLRGLDETTSANNTYDVIGLAGAVWASAVTGIDLDPTTGVYASADSTAALVTILLTMRTTDGAWKWSTSLTSDPSNADTQTTAFAILALNAHDRATYLADIVHGAAYIRGMQDASGQFLLYPGDTPGSAGSVEVHAEALAALVTVAPFPTTTTITADVPDPSDPDQTVSVSATVTSDFDTPTGNVYITGADTNCAITLSSGSGSCDVVFATSGAKTLTATYGGDAVFAGSTDTENHTVNPNPPDLVTLVSPSGYIGTDYTPTYTWNAVSDADAYFLQVNGPSGILFQQLYAATAVCSGATCSITPALTLAGGVHSWYVRGWNADGWGPWSAPLVFSTAPDTTITGNPDLLSASADATFTFTSDDPDATFECSLDGNAFASCTSPQDYIGLVDGSHTFEARAIEGFGHPDPTPASYTWTIDTAAPDTAITSHPSDPSGSANASFSFTSTEAGSTFECSLDGSAFASCNDPQDYTGLADASHTFQVRATDLAGNTDPTPASYTWTVNAVNDPPTLALSNTVTSLAENADTSAAIKVADITITDDGLGTNTLSLSGADAALFEITSSALYLEAGATLDYETNPVLNVTVAVNDPAVGGNPDDSESLAISITDINEAPVAHDQSVTTDEDTPVAITLTGSDVDGDPLTFTVVDDPLHGTLTGTVPDLTYTPDANYNGLDSFTFKANDGALDSNTATVSITVNPVNDAPVCAPVSLDTDEDTAGQANPSCTDTEGDTLSYSIVSQPAHGSASVALGKLVYTPDADYNGPDSFIYKANDGTADSNTATVTVTVNPVNDAPVADAQSVTTDEDTPVAITLTGSDVDGDALTFAIATPPAHGTLSGSAPNLTYTPEADYSGPDSFTFTVNDGLLDSTPATVTITVAPVNDAPVANAQTVSTLQDTPLPITLTGSDVENDPLTFAITTSPAHGTLSGTAPDLTYTPDAGFSGSDSFSFTVNDGLLDSAPALVTINVAYVNTAPTDITLSNASVEENKPVGTTVGTFTTTDPDAGDTFTYTFCGGADDASFTLDLDTLKTAEVFDFETKASYDICIQTDDGNGGTFQEAFTIAVTDGKPVTLTFRSQAAYDGWVLESAENSNKGGTLNSTTTTFNLGDTLKNQQFRGILSFSTGSLPDNAVITKVLIKVRKQGLVGTDPFTTHLGLKVDIRRWTFSGNKLLQITDFQAFANKDAIGTFNKVPANSWYTARLYTTAFPFINLNGLTQFRLRFAKDDNNDNGSDYVKFFSGNAALANRPQLIITYYVP